MGKIFKTYSQKEVKRVMPIVKKINELEEEISKLTDSELRAKTDYFKKQLAEGKTLDDILPESFFSSSIRIDLIQLCITRRQQHDAHQSHIK